MTWSDSGESSILLTERDPANRVTLIDLTQTPVVSVPVATGVPARPSSVEVTAANRILVCSNDEIVQIDLTGSVFTSAGPLLIGIGHVPKSKITGGLRHHRCRLLLPGQGLSLRRLPGGDDQS